MIRAVIRLQAFIELWFLYTFMAFINFWSSMAFGDFLLGLYRVMIIDCWLSYTFYRAVTFTYSTESCVFIYFYRAVSFTDFLTELYPSYTFFFYIEPWVLDLRR